jgi:hypothetical protein
LVLETNDPFQISYQEITQPKKKEQVSNSSQIHWNGEFHYFRDYSKVLCSTNVDTLKTTTTTLNIPDDMRFDSTVCLLPDDSIFAYYR